MMVHSSWKILPLLLLHIGQSHCNRDPHISRNHIPVNKTRAPTPPYLPLWNRSTPRSHWTTRPTRTPMPPTISQCGIPNGPVKLNFTQIGLQRVGDNFVESPEVTELYLGYNDIRQVSPFLFTSLPKLEVLDLSGNNISVGKMLRFDGHDSLQKLVIDDNKCQEYDTELVDISQSLSSLKKLSLRRSCISRFAVNLRKFAPRLDSLYLSGNRIESPEFFDHLPETLTHLHLDDNLIPNVKGEVLKTIKDLSVSGNKIKQVCGASCDGSKSLGLSWADKLEVLNASRNEISEVMDTAFANMKGLLRLDLSGNKLAELPDTVFEGLTWLEELHMSRNQLTSIPHVCPLTRMKWLDLSGNQIMTIAKGNFCTLSMSLETLLLANNYITTVHSDVFSGLQVLRKLDLSNNLIVTLPARMILDARSLQILSLKNNSIANLDGLREARSSSLQELYLQDNPLLHLKVTWIHPEYLPNLVIHLKDASLNDNQAVTDENVISKPITTEDTNDAWR